MVLCEKHGEFGIRYGHLKEGKGCPTCKESKGEKKIRTTLEKYQVKYIPQKRFKDLYRYKGKYLSYDFYIPSQKLLIEYQGEYHDTIMAHTTRDSLSGQKERDRIKSEYAQRKGYKLLEIWYWDYENIENILYKEGVI